MPSYSLIWPFETYLTLTSHTLKEDKSTITGGGRITDEWEKAIPIQRRGQREEIANCVLFVVSRGGELITGSSIIADGGHYLTNSNNYYAVSKLKSLI